MQNASAEQQIRGIIGSWLDVVASNDAQAISRFYTEDGRFMVPNAPIAKGREAIAGMWGHLLGLPGAKLSFGPTEFDFSTGSDMALEVGTYQLGFDGSGGRIEDRGKYVVVWKRVDGAWQAAADILNSDLPAKD